MFAFSSCHTLLKIVPAVTYVDRWKHSRYILNAHTVLGVRAPQPYAEKQDDKDTLLERIRHNLLRIIIDLQRKRKLISEAGERAWLEMSTPPPPPTAKAIAFRLRAAKSTISF